MNLPKLFATCFTLCAIAAGAMGAPTTSPVAPPGYPPEKWAGYLEGWSQAGGQIELPPVTPIDLAPIVKAAKDGSTVNLTKGEYFLKTLCIVDKTLTINGNGSLLTCPPTGGTFHPSKSHLTLNAFVVKKCALFLDDWADSCTVSDCEFGRGQPDGSIGQLCKTGPGGTNPIFIRCYCGKTNTVTFYSDRDGFTILACEFAGSLGEYVIRSSSPDGTIIPKGGLIQDSKISNHNGFGKHAIGLRERHDFKIQNCQISGFTRYGQTNKPTNIPADKYASGTIANCTFSDPDKQPFVSVLQGATVTVTGCIWLYPQAACIAGDKPSVTTTSNNIEQIVAGSKVWPFYASANGGTLIDQGGNRVIEVPK